MKKFVLLGVILAVLLLTACSSSGYPDYSSPEKSIESLKHAAADKDARLMYDVFSLDYREEFGVTYELFKADLDNNPSEYNRISNIRVDQVYDQGDVQIIILEDGDRIFMINERGYWKIRLITPPTP